MKGISCGNVVKIIVISTMNFFFAISKTAEW